MKKASKKLKHIEEDEWNVSKEHDRKKGKIVRHFSASHLCFDEWWSLLKMKYQVKTKQPRGVRLWVKIFFFHEIQFPSST